MAALDPLDVMAFIIGYSGIPSEEWRARWPEWCERVDEAYRRLEAELAGGRTWAKSDPHVENGSDAAYRWVFLPLMRECLAASLAPHHPRKANPMTTDTDLGALIARVEGAGIEASLEYRAIVRFYGGGYARRSGVPLMAHIDEGLAILSELGATDVTKRAFCLHPIVQNEEPVDVSWSTCLGIAEEYRDRANAYLCTPATDGVKTVRQVRNRVGHMTSDCRLMLIADKRQNSKDFERYHADHPRAEQLRRYFSLWLEFLAA